MSYTIKWAIENRVIETILNGVVSLDDVHNMRRNVIEDFLSQPNAQRVHSIFDISKWDHFDFEVKQFLETPRQVQFSAEQTTTLGWRVYFGKDDRSFRFITTVFHQAEGHQTQWFLTREEALAFLKRVDPTL